MKCSKYLLFVLLSFILVVAGCNDSDGASGTTDNEKDVNLNETGFPIVDEEITLTFLAGAFPSSNPDWNDVLIFNEYETMTNMDIEWEMVPTTGLEERRNLALGSADLPDAFHTAGVPKGDLLRYGEQGVFISLNDLIEEYAPNLVALLEEYPEVRAALTFPDGNIYSFPTIFSPDFLSVLLGPRPWISQEILSELDMNMPKTTEDYYQFLTAVKEHYPDGEIIPVGSYNIDFILRWITGSFGINNKGLSHIVDIDPETEDLRFVPTSEGYKEMLAYMHKLYSEGLIEQNIFSMETDQYLANATSGLYASTVSQSPIGLFGESVGENYNPAPALQGPNGDQLYVGLSSVVNNTGGFVITSENEHPEATVRWLDYFYSDEGTRMFFLGIEGETYEIDENGEYQYIDEIVNSPEGLTFEQELGKYLTWLGGGYPGIVTQEYFHGLENSPQALDATEKLEPHIIDEVWPQFNHTKEENDYLLSQGADIRSFVTESRDLFISGKRPLSEWDDYVKTLENMGLEEYMKVMEATVKRYEDS